MNLKGFVVFGAYVLMLCSCGDSGSGTNADEAGNGSNKGGSSNTVNPSNDNGSSMATFIEDPRDGNVYAVKKIGDALWMTENLRIKDTLAYPMDADSTKCPGDSTEASCQKMGRLYKWMTAVNNNQSTDTNSGICPPGWRLPNDKDFSAMVSSLGSNDTLLYKKFQKNGWLNEEDSSSIYWSTYYSDYMSQPGGFIRRRGLHAITVLKMIKGYRSVVYMDYGFLDDYGYVRCLQNPEADSVKDYDDFLANKAKRTEYIRSTLEGAKRYMNKELKYGSFVDERDGNEYYTIKIGDQKWMAENLRYFPGDEYYKTYWDYVCYSQCSHEDSVDYYTNGVAYESSWAFPQSDTVGPVCPSGWRIPSKDDWDELRMNADTDQALLATGSLWESALNTTGFTAMPTSSDKTSGVDPFAETRFFTSELSAGENVDEENPKYKTLYYYWFDDGFTYSDANAAYIRCIQE